MLTTDFLAKVHNYLAGSLTLEDLEAWIVPRLPALYALLPSSSTKLIDEIEFGLIEIDAGRLSELDFRQALQKAISEQPVFVQYPEEEGVTRSGSSNTIIYGSTTFKVSGVHWLHVVYT